MFIYKKSNPNKIVKIDSGIQNEFNVILQIIRKTRTFMAGFNPDKIIVSKDLLQASAGVVTTFGSSNNLKMLERLNNKFSGNNAKDISKFENRCSEYKKAISAMMFKSETSKSVNIPKNFFNIAAVNKQDKTNLPNIVNSLDQENKSILQKPPPFVLFKMEAKSLESLPLPKDSKSCTEQQMKNLLVISNTMYSLQESALEYISYIGRSIKSGVSSSQSGSRSKSKGKYITGDEITKVDFLPNKIDKNTSSISIVIETGRNKGHFDRAVKNKIKTTFTSISSPSQKYTYYIHLIDALLAMSVANTSEELKLKNFLTQATGVELLITANKIKVRIKDLTSSQNKSNLDVLTKDKGAILFDPKGKGETLKVKAGLLNFRQTQILKEAIGEAPLYKAVGPGKKTYYYSPSDLKNGKLEYSPGKYFTPKGTPASLSKIVMSKNFGKKK